VCGSRSLDVVGAWFNSVHTYDPSESVCARKQRGSGPVVGVMAIGLGINPTRDASPLFYQARNVRASRVLDGYATGLGTR
jgi:hypothetical protein